jgi:hypothetical protein
MEPIWLGRFSKKATKSMVPIEGLQGEHSGAWKSEDGVGKLLNKAICPCKSKEPLWNLSLLTVVC